MTETKTQVLLKTVIETPKNDSSFLYFTLESNEGIAFYSTLAHQEGDQERVIECFVPLELKQEFTNIIESLKQTITLKILSQEEIKDSL